MLKGNYFRLNYHTLVNEWDYFQEKIEKIMFTQVESFIFNHKLRLHIPLSSKGKQLFQPILLPVSFDLNDTGEEIKKRTNQGHRSKDSNFPNHDAVLVSQDCSDKLPLMWVFETTAVVFKIAKFILTEIKTKVLAEWVPFGGLGGMRSASLLAFSCCQHSLAWGFRTSVSASIFT